MGLVALHSAHASKILSVLLGTETARLRWRENDDFERVWTLEPGHPIAEGVPEYIDIPKSEMYGELFHIPTPDELIFMSWYDGGELFRSGCTFKRGLGRIFYFSPGHESFPIYHMPEIQKIITNGVKWVAPTHYAKVTTGHTPERIHKAESKLPQLLMRRDNLSDLPALNIPEGFSIRTYQEGDDTAWEDLTEASLGFRLNFFESIRNNPFFMKERIFFICDGDKMVATAIAWGVENEPLTGYVHMVGADAEYRGKGLGYQVSLAVLHRMKEEGMQQVILHTDDFRIPAIAIYLKLGFEPQMTHESHESRWEKVKEILGHAPTSRLL